MQISSGSDMEIDFLVLFLIFFSTFLLLKLGSKFRSTNSVSPLPPGPWKLPFIGNIHQLVGSLPHRALRDLAKKYGPLMHLQLGEISTVVVSSPEYAKEVMKTHDINFASRPRIIALDIVTYGCTNIGLSPYGEYWRQLRKICTTELLSIRRVQSFRSLREEETSNFARWLASNAGSPINLTEKIHSFTFATTSRAAFGKKNAEQEEFISLAKETIKLAEAFNIADIYPSLKFLHRISGVTPILEKVHMEMDRIFENIINEHRKGFAATIEKHETQKDLVDVLLKYHEDQRLEFTPSISNIKAIILEIFTAGTETSSTTVDWAMTEMIKNPKIMKKAQEEVRQVFSAKGYVDEDDFDKLTYMKSVIRETLRLHPPLPLLLPRQSNERCVINGYEIPAKTNIMVNAWAINRDPSYWKDAELFQPERFLDNSIDYRGTHFEYIPFGAGRRICAGMHLGMANVEHPLAKLLYHFDWNLPSGMKPEELDLAEAPGFTVRRRDDLYVVPVVKNPLPVE